MLHKANIFVIAILGQFAGMLLVDKYFINHNLTSLFTITVIVGLCFIAFILLLKWIFIRIDSLEELSAGNSYAFEILSQCCDELKMTAPKIYLQNCQNKILCCFGIGPAFFRGFIISRGMLNLLTDKELKSAILHELAHFRNHDIAQLTVIQIIVYSYLIYALCLLRELFVYIIHKNR
jgi:Zn-dependent protease with chaperone function